MGKERSKLDIFPDGKLKSNSSWHVLGSLLDKTNSYFCSLLNFHRLSIPDGKKSEMRNKNININKVTKSTLHDFSE